MANKKTLQQGNPNIAEYGKDTQFSSGCQAVENGGKGGKASVKAKRKRKEFKEALKLALTVVMDNDKTVQEIGIEALMDRFMKGDPKVFELIRDTIGEKPTDKQEVKVVDSDWFK